MMKWALAILVLGCGDSGITPDPSGTTSNGTGAGHEGGSTSTGANTSNGGAPTVGGSHQGGTSEGGAVATGGSNQGGSPAMPGLGYENGSRLRANVYVGADGSRQFKNWQDTQLGIECSFQRAADGVTRCLPSEVATILVGQFSDDACTQPVAARYCQTPTAYAISYDQTTCPVTAHVKAIGGAVAAAYYSGGLGCGTIGFSGPSVQYFSIGAEVPASTFAAANIVTE